jgi:mannose-6-phosphate isomerase-like protein (cupin superfamily)/putative sterol carrier protein
MKKILVFLLAFVPVYSVQAETESTQKILETFVVDFRSDPMAKDREVTFGIKIKDKEDWHVVIDGQGGAALNEGEPEQPTFYYVTDYETLYLIYQGKMSALTAMGRARMSDQTPMNFGFMEGFQPTPDLLGWGAKFTFHFWTRGTPEMVDFSDNTLSRFIHGAQAKILYYEQGLRSSWYQIQKGQHINADPEEQTNPFPTLIIMIKGEAQAKIGGDLVTLKSGTCLHIPATVTHEFWNDKEEAAEFIIVMFGEGA